MVSQLLTRNPMLLTGSVICETTGGIHVSVLWQWSSGKHTQVSKHINNIKCSIFKDPLTGV